MKKIFITILIFISIINNTIPVFADDEDIEDEEIDFEETLQASTETTDFPSINSRAAVIYDRTSGTVICGKNENEIRKMASTTKIMTCLIVLENCNLTETAEVSSKAAGTGGSRLGLTTGAKITVNDLLYGLMLCSGNDAAVALAEHTAGSVEEFAVLMNNKAQELGLEHTHFVTPHGLDQEEHYTTAFELAKIADYALNVPEFAKIVKTKNYTVTINGYPKSLNNTNELLGNLNGVYGVKTGFTNGANRCLVTAIKRDNLDIICVVLGADTKKFRTQDSIKLIEYAFKNYSLVNINGIIDKEFAAWKEQNKYTLEIIKGKSKYANLVINLEGEKYYPVQNDKKGDIRVTIETEKELSAPVNQNQVVGRLSVILDNKEIESINIVCETDINKKNYLDYFKELIQNYTKYLSTIENKMWNYI